MRTVTIPAYTESRFEFAELSRKAQSNALEQWAMHQGSRFWDSNGPEHDCGYSAVADALGFTVEGWSISGFSCQGDGASFIGKWDASKAAGAVEAVKEWSNADRVAKLAVEAAELAKGGGGTFTIGTNGSRYSHEYTMTVEQDDWSEDDPDPSEAVLELARNLARWAYRTAQEEYDYFTGIKALLDEQGEGCIEFRENGAIVWNPEAE